MPSFTVIEITESEAKVLVTQKQKKKDISILHAFSVDYTGLANDEEGYIQRGAMLRDAFKPLKIPAGVSALLIPKQDAIIRTVVLPWSAPEELAEMAMFEAEKFIPFNIERHIISNSVLTMDQMQGCDTLITAIDGPAIDNLLLSSNAANLELRVAEVTCLGLVRSFVETMQIEDHEAINILLDIGSTQTEVTVLQGDLIVTCRSQSLGVDRLLASLKEAMHIDRDIQPSELAQLDLANPDGFIVEGGSASEVDDTPGATRVGNQVRDWVNRTIRFIRTYSILSPVYSSPPTERSTPRCFAAWPVPTAPSFALSKKRKIPKPRTRASTSCPRTSSNSRRRPSAKCS